VPGAAAQDVYQDSDTGQQYLLSRVADGVQTWITDGNPIKGPKGDEAAPVPMEAVQIGATVSVSGTTPQTVTGGYTALPDVFLAQIEGKGRAQDQDTLTGLLTLKTEVARAGGVRYQVGGAAQRELIVTRSGNDLRLVGSVSSVDVDIMLFRLQGQGTGDAEPPTLANVTSALGLDPVAAVNRGKIIVRKSDETGYSYDDPVDLGPVQDDIADLKNVTGDLIAGSPSTGWSDVTTTAQGGIVAVDESSRPGNAAAAAALTGWAANARATFGQSGVARIPRAADPQQYRVRFANEDGASTDLVSHWTRLGTSGSYAYYVTPGGLATETITLQTTGSSAHVGTSKFTGITLPGQISGVTADGDKFLRQDGTWADVPAAVELSDDPAQPPGPAAAGDGDKASRDDHVHRPPTWGEVTGKPAIPQPGSTLPLAPGASQAGTSARYSRADHRHRPPTWAEVTAKPSPYIGSKADLAAHLKAAPAGMDFLVNEGRDTVDLTFELDDFDEVDTPADTDLLLIETAQGLGKIERQHLIAAAAAPSGGDAAGTETVLQTVTSASPRIAGTVAKVAQHEIFELRITITAVAGGFQGRMGFILGSLPAGYQRYAGNNSQLLEAAALPLSVSWTIGRTTTGLPADAAFTVTPVPVGTGGRNFTVQFSVVRAGTGGAVDLAAVTAALGLQPVAASNRRLMVVRKNDDTGYSYSQVPIGLPREFGPVGGRDGQFLGFVGNDEDWRQPADLTAAAALKGTDIVMVDQGSGTRRTTIEALGAAIGPLAATEVSQTQGNKNWRIDGSRPNGSGVQIKVDASQPAELLPGLAGDAERFDDIAPHYGRRYMAWIENQKFWQWQWSDFPVPTRRHLRIEVTFGWQQIPRDYAVVVRLWSQQNEWGMTNNRWDQFLGDSDGRNPNPGTATIIYDVQPTSAITPGHWLKLGCWLDYRAQGNPALEFGGEIRTVDVKFRIPTSHAGPDWPDQTADAHPGQVTP